MVQRFNELPFLEKEDRIAVAAKVVFQKAIEDIHSSLKFVTFVSHVINIIFYNWIIIYLYIHMLLKRFI